MAQYYKKLQPVDAWQYTGEIILSKLPNWVSNLVLHCRLGYRADGIFKFDNHGIWIPVCEGDWLVRYTDDAFSVISDADFKVSFEEVK